MLFNSPTFVVFFATVFCLYWVLRERRWQNSLLLLASYVFYGAWSWKFLLLLMASTLFDYTCGRLLAGQGSQAARRRIVFASVAINLLFLGTFKYANFFVREATELLALLGFQANVRTLEVVLPVGISFYTFQSLSYVIDVYRGKLQPVRNLADYALYVAFFPQLVAGPIERAAHMLPQYQRERTLTRTAFESGLQLMVWGLFKKIVIADNLAPYVNAVYGDPQAFSGTAIATATLFFAFQIYCDFSGYSDTARGAARTLGFELISNFQQPYFSRNPVEFWRRWHISLSQWFQDYLYFPLAMRFMRQGGWASKYKAHIISMALIGFWHGASVTFIVFGLYWGFVIAGYLYVQERISEADPGTLLERVGRQLQSNRVVDAACVIVMFAMVCFGWIFFRASTMAEAWYVITHMFATGGATDVVRAEVVSSGILWMMVAGLWLAEWVYRNRPAVVAVLEGGNARSVAARHAMFAAILFSYLVTQQGRAQPFIYFQF
ncbi:MAG TPA: MBOAT family O-acyltransferase [Steroidobacteraceae bacterium]|nr:MBOAT family O-acyltransferase [Steroidobacteraceae bacterium]